MAHFSRLTRAIRDLRTWLWFGALVVGLVASFRASASDAHFYYNNQPAASAACTAENPPPGHSWLTKCAVYHVTTTVGGVTYTSTYQSNSTAGGWSVHWWYAGGPTPPTPEECAAEEEWLAPTQLPNGAVVCDLTNSCAFQAVNDDSGGPALMIPYEVDVGEGMPCDPHSGGAATWTCPSGWIYVGGADSGMLQNYCLPPEGDADSDGIPNEDDDAPTEYGDTPRDSDEDGIPDSQDSAPFDPENGEDTTGDESDNTSTGGGNCSTPPVSSGDGIAAQIAFQTWATRCEVQRLRTAGSSGSVTVNVEANTEGNELLEEIVDNTDTLAGEGDPTAGEAASGDGTADAAFDEAPGGDALGDGLDDTGWLGGTRACPDLPALDLTAMGGGTVDLNDSFGDFCFFMEIGGQFVLLFTALFCARIMRKAV